MIDMNTIRFDKLGGIIPVCVQDARTAQLLMVGFMNSEALQATMDTNIVTFYSRSKQRLWMKGETSGNTLTVERMCLDCDQDTLLIQATPTGPTCHTGEISCFSSPSSLSGLWQMISTIDERMRHPKAGSYTCELLQSGLPRMAQKVGEEGVEVALAAVTQDNDAFINEAADLLFHLCVLLRAKGLRLENVSDELQNRHARSATV